MKKIYFALALPSSLAWTTSPTAYDSRDYVNLCVLGRDRQGQSNAQLPKGILATPHTDGTNGFSLSIQCHGKTAEGLFLALLQEGHRATRKSWTANNVVETIRFTRERLTGCYHSLSDNLYWCHLRLLVNDALAGAFERVQYAPEHALNPVNRTILAARNSLSACVGSQHAFLRSQGSFGKHFQLGCEGARPSLAERMYLAFQELSDKSIPANINGVPVVEKKGGTRYQFGDVYGAAKSFCEQRGGSHACAVQIDL